MAELPHFDLPFRFAARAGSNALAAAVVEQDTADDVMACVVALAVTPLGHRLEAPEYGLPELTFMAAADVDDVIAAAIAEHEPRGSVRLVRTVIAPGGDTAVTASVAPRTDY